MPSRNKRNKNRQNNSNATSGANVPKNDASAAKISDSSGSSAMVSKESEADAEQSPNLKSTIDEAKDKLEELQQHVDSIKASISQTNAAAAVSSSLEVAADEPKTIPEQMAEQQNDPQKKKRHRNRNRKKNSPGGGNESGVSSSSGTHENSPSFSAPIELPTLDVITSEIKEESLPTESSAFVPEIATETLEKQTKPNAEVPKPCETFAEICAKQVQASKQPAKSTKEPTDAAEKEAPANVKSPEINVDETKVGADVKIDTAQAKEVEPIQTENVPSDETKPIKNEQRSQQNKADQKTKANDSRKKEIVDKVEKSADKKGTPDKNKQSPETKPKNNNNNNNKNQKDPKKSPKQNKKVQPNDKNEPNGETTSVETVEPIAISTAEPANDNKIKITEEAPTKIDEPSESSKEPQATSSELQAPLELKVSSNESPTIQSEPNADSTESEVKKAESNVTLLAEDTTKTPTSSPIVTTPAPETAKKLIQQEDETAKIWKILEEASKSLEPVEIQMDDEPTADKPAIPPPIELSAPVLCTSKDQQQIDEETKDLVTLLESKELNKPKQSSPPKATKGKESGQSSPTSKEGSPTKAVDVQPQKPAEPKKKDAQKPTQKNAKANKPNQQQERTSNEQTPERSEPEQKSEKTPEKIPLPEKFIEKLVDKPSPIESASDTGPPPLPPNDEVPLDMSILDQVDVPEISTDSKNVQGSGFVPSVEQSTAEAKSLEPKKTIESPEVRESKSKSKSKSKSPLKSNTEADEPITAPILTEQMQAKRSPSKDVEQTIAPDVNNNNSKSSKAAVTPESKGVQKKSIDPEKRNQTGANGKQKDPNAKSVQGKNASNAKKPNEKPVIPPKPNNLVSSQARKSQVNATSKSAKTEKILVLTGANADDDDSEDNYIEYKFMPRQVFIATICQSCKKPTKFTERILCQLCQMVSYCCAEHVTKDLPMHKDLCAALQEIAKKRGGHIYNNARILNDNDYRSLRVHTLNLCENFLKRPLQTYEREILLFPRLCSATTCREWRPNVLTDCENCGQAFYCTSQPEHLTEMHRRWCKSVALYRNLVVKQSVSGRIEPSLPSRIQTKPYILPGLIADVFKDLYKNYSVLKDECIFATLTQLATAPLTAFFAAQKADLNIGETLTIHLIGAELQFEADVLDIWETFFLHLAHNLMELTIVFCGPELNAENIPLDIISRIRMCRTCRQNCRIVKFDFQCAKLYHDYAKSSSYSKPDLICFFNPGFHHISSLNGYDTWTETIKIASLSECPVVVTSYTEYESPRDFDRFHHESTNHGKQMKLMHGPELNPYASQRPERNFISDEIVPLIFKNYFCFVLK